MAGRITQEAVEVLHSGSPSGRVTQDAIEILHSGTPSGRVTQIAIEVLFTYVAPPTDSTISASDNYNNLTEGVVLIALASNIEIGGDSNSLSDAMQRTLSVRMTPLSIEIFDKVNKKDQIAGEAALALEIPETVASNERQIFESLDFDDDVEIAALYETLPEDSLSLSDALATDFSAAAEAFDSMQDVLLDAIALDLPFGLNVGIVDEDVISLNDAITIGVVEVGIQVEVGDYDDVFAFYDEIAIFRILGRAVVSNFILSDLMAARVASFLETSDLLSLSDAVSAEIPPEQVFGDALAFLSEAEISLSQSLTVEVGDDLEDMLRIIDDSDLLSFALNRVNSIEYLRRYLNDVPRGIGRG